MYAYLLVYPHTVQTTSPPSAMHYQLSFAKAMATIFAHPRHKGKAGGDTWSKGISSEGNGQSQNQ